jgi:alanine dehydrogenase
MRVGVVKEIKPDENRVALTPDGAQSLARAGHDVLVEAGAGTGSAIQDNDYVEAGARVAATADVWGTCDLVLKVKEPTPTEFHVLREGQVVFTFLHLAADRALTQALVDSGAAAVAYETVEVNGALPLLAPMSAVAGRLAAQVGAHFLGRPSGGRGLLAGGVAGVEPATVVILGGGVVGYNAAVIAIGLGAKVVILERSIDRMRHLEEVLRGRVALVMSSSLAIELALEDADLVVGAVLVPGARAPSVVSREMVAAMKERAVVVDVAIDQGGCFATSIPTTHADPVYLAEGVMHYCVTNMPGAVPVTSTRALTNATLPFVELIAATGLHASASSNPAVAKGVNVLAGNVVNEAVAEAHKLPYRPLADVLATT